MATKEKEFVIGIDLGGTKIYSAVVDRYGKIHGAARKKTKSEQGFVSTVNRIVQCTREAIAEAEVTLEAILAIGVGSPGPLDLKAGRIIETPNLKWKDAPIRDLLQDAFGKPVKVDNDGNVGMLGEYTYGAGHGAKHMVGLFIGTGIGGGVMVDGKLLHGFNENAAELGHMILDPHGPKCGCGNNGCLEAFASRLAIEREIRAAAVKGVKTKVFDDLKDKNTRIRSRRLAEAFAAEDPAVAPAIRTSAEYVGYAVASLLNIFNPEVVVLGGGVIEAIGEPYVKIARETAAKNVFDVAMRNVRIVSAELKDDSAVLGAAVLGWEAIGE